MVPGVTKTDKLHLFDDRNLRSLVRLYNWNGQQTQKDIIKTKKNKKLEESLNFEDVILFILLFVFIIRII